MEIKKKLIISLLVLLCGCSNAKTVSCSCYDGKDSLTLKIDAVNDDIRMIEVIEVFELPQDLLADEVRFRQFEGQLDKSYHLEENRLVRNYSLSLNGI